LTLITANSRALIIGVSDLSRPMDKDYRVAILGAFDRHSIRSIKEVCNHLQEVGQFKSYQSTRRMLIRLAKEGLLTELPQRTDKNSVQYTKLVFKTNVKLIAYNQDVVSLGAYIHRLVNEQFPEIIDEQATIVIKHWMLESLASAYPDGYSGKRDVPDPNSLQKKLEGTLSMLKDMHSFLKNFLDSGVFTPVARSNIAKDFMKHYSQEHVVIVEELWNTDDSRKRNRDD
jgi:hypothetical protein